MIDLKKIDELVTRLGESLPPAANQLREDIESGFRSVLKSAFEKMDLVTREEFEVVREMAEKARAENQRLQEEIDALKQRD